MKLSDFKDEKALDAFADLIEPVSEILADENVSKALQSGKTIAAAKAAIKGHHKAVLTALAVLDGADPAEYHVSLLALPVKLLSVLNDPELTELFRSAEQTSDETSSIPRLESIEGGAH